MPSPIRRKPGGKVNAWTPLHLPQRQGDFGCDRIAICVPCRNLTPIGRRMLNPARLPTTAVTS